MRGTASTPEVAALTELTAWTRPSITALGAFRRPGSSVAGTDRQITLFWNQNSGTYGNCSPLMVVPGPAHAGFPAQRLGGHLCGITVERSRDLQPDPTPLNGSTT
jgi:hypothetical protein